MRFHRPDESGVIIVRLEIEVREEGREECRVGFETESFVEEFVKVRDERRDVRIVESGGVGSGSSSKILHPEDVGLISEGDFFEIGGGDD